MAFTEAEIQRIAKAREQEAVLVFVNGQSKWLLTDALPCSIDQLAQSLGSDSYDDYCEGKLLPFDSNGNPIVDRDARRNWKAEGHVKFMKPPKKGSGRAKAE